MAATTKRTTALRYEAICDRCYTCRVAISSRRRDVEVAATGHGNAYGHNVHIVDHGPNRPTLRMVIPNEPFRSAMVRS